MNSKRKWALSFARLVATGLSIWAALALFCDVPTHWVGVGLGAILLGLSAGQWWKAFSPRRTPILLTLLGSAGAWLWWINLTPSNVGPWAPEFAELSWAAMDGDRVTFHNVRNFNYRSEHDFDAVWETRGYDLGQLEGADLFLTHWGVPLVAHSIVSFRFANQPYLATSIEARRRATQEYSAWKGFFRQFPISFIVADERDVIGVRANFRQAENVYLYRTRLSAVDARLLLLDFIGRMNALRNRPQWYNALTYNCGSAMVTDLARRHIGRVTRWDWRSVLAGEADNMLFDLGDLETSGLPFRALKAQALINAQAHRAGDDPQFSARIRENRAGIPASPLP